MTIGIITHAKSASDAKTSAALTTNHGAVVVDSIVNDGLITTAAGLANAPNITTTSHVTQTTASAAANVSAMTPGVVPFPRDAEIFQRDDGAIENMLRSAPGYVVATS